jgi:UDP-glucose 4-epimerase
MSKETVAVLGGSGFIGRHVVEKLDEIGFSVKILDKKVDNLQKEKHSIFEADILDKDALNECIKDSKFVFNFAGIADIKEASNNPLKTIEKNIMGSTMAIEAALNAKVKKYLYASTMYVYSDRGGFYRTTKQASEDIICSYNEKYGIEYVMLRYGTIYGPGAQKWNSMRKYIQQILETGKVDYIGNGEEIREYIHVDDAAQLSIDALDENYTNCRLNITGSQVLKSVDMLHMIGEIVGKKVEINFIKNDPYHNHYISTPYRYSSKRAKKVMPKDYIDIGHGIMEIIQDLDQKK